MSEKFPELFFGLVGAIGTDLELIQQSLQKSLMSVGYVAVEVRLSDLMRELNSDWYAFPARSDTDYYERAMDGGNKLRQDMNRADAMAALAMSSIRRRRKKNEAATEKVEKRAYILTSLKRSEEVDLLRSVYGASVSIVSGYSPRSFRVGRLASQLAEKEHHNQIAAHRGRAEELILRDESESGAWGQEVRKAYPLADLFVDTTRPRECSEAIERFIGLLFGDPWRSPSLDEQSMAFAYIASLRSASPARQVGAALIDESGNILSVGTNEVASPGGGQYWESDSNDGRDVVFDRIDTSDRMRRNLLSDILRRLKDLEILREDCIDPNLLLDPASSSFESLRKAQLFDTIDFIRAVHAEASALLSATGKTQGSTIYVTTFPCHECARHIVFSGVKRAVYIHPYPKSLVTELFRDSISVDGEDGCEGKVSFVPFTGISPSTYQQLFLLTTKTRKEKDGTLNKWIAAQSSPHLHTSFSERATTMAEAEKLAEFEEALKKKGISDDSIPRTT
jgi:deoxycytidylate deaminase